MSRKKIPIPKYTPKYIYQRYNGQINKLEEIKENEYIDVKTGIVTNKDYLLLGKVSKNIEDLIEAGDIIKFEYDNANYIEEVIRFDCGDTYFSEVCFSSEDGIGYTINIYDESIKIKSIVTKEQYENIEFEV